MKAAARNVLIVIAAAQFGLLLAMNLPKRARVDNGLVPEWTAANPAGANNAPEVTLVVDKRNV